MPVKFFSSPRRAFSYRPFGSRCSATASGVSTNTSMNSPSAAPARAPCRRSARNGEMNDTSTIRPASTISLRHLGDAADVLDAVGVGEAEVLVEAVADVVAVEQVGVAAERVQPLLDQVGDGRLAGAGQAGEPEHARLLALERRARGLVDVERLPVDVLRRGAARSAACRRRPCRWSCGRSG